MVALVRWCSATIGFIVWGRDFNRVGRVSANAAEGTCGVVSNPSEKVFTTSGNQFTAWVWADFGSGLSMSGNDGRWWGQATNRLAARCCVQCDRSILIDHAEFGPWRRRGAYGFGVSWSGFFWGGCGVIAV